MAEHGPAMGQEATGDGWGLAVFAAVMMIALDSFVIWALAAHRRAVAA